MRPTYPNSHASPAGPHLPDLPARPAFKVTEVARLLGISPSTVRRLIRRGQLRPCRALRHLLIPADQVFALLQS